MERAHSGLQRGPASSTGLILMQIAHLRQKTPLPTMALNFTS